MGSSLTKKSKKNEKLYIKKI